MKRLKAFLKADIDWRQFVLGAVCLFFGTLNLYYATGLNLVSGGFALVMAGVSFSGSLLSPIIKDYGRKFDEMTARFDRLDPKAAAKAAAAAFKAEILKMQARGELGPDIQIVFGDGPPPEFKPPGRLN
jgi:hypothetical protein